MKDPALILAEYSQKYVEAVEAEKAMREATFVADFDVIGNIKVHSLTPKLRATLELMKSPFIIGGTITTPNVLTFLWVIKVKSPNETHASFCESITLTENLHEILNDIDSYLKGAFNDASGSTEETTVPYWGNIAVLVDLFAGEYGWEPQTIINMPYKQIWQLVKIISKRNDPKKPLFNRSDSVKTEMLIALNSNK